MSHTEPSRPVLLEDLVALNTEIAALVRAGIPLELGFGGLRGGLPHRLGPLTDRLRARMEQGVTLDAALAAEDQTLPPVYWAVVHAGLKSGRLPDALESLARFGQMLLDLRRRIGLALLYPSIVVLTAYLLLWFLLSRMAGELVETYQMFGLTERGWMAVLLFLGETVGWWGPVPLVFAGMAVVWWFVSGRFVSPIAGIGGAWLRWVPGIGRIVANFHRATFADLLATLVEQRVPLPEALPLAAGATGDRRTIAAAAHLAGRVQNGESLAEALKSESRFPPFMKWMIAAGEQQGALSSSLRQVTQLYHRRAVSQADWFKLALPIVLTVCVGGGVVLFYGLMLFAPLRGLLYGLGG